MKPNDAQNVSKGFIDGSPRVQRRCHAKRRRGEEHRYLTQRRGGAKFQPIFFAPMRLCVSFDLAASVRQSSPQAGPWLLPSPCNVRSWCMQRIGAKFGAEWCKSWVRGSKEASREAAKARSRGKFICFVSSYLRVTSSAVDSGSAVGQVARRAEDPGPRLWLVPGVADWI
jgi:hypothetical protein